jgi:hypothetical protein
MRVDAPRLQSYREVLMDWGRCDRLFRRRTVVALLVFIAALLCSDGVRSARAASPADNRVVTVSYQGSYHGTINYDEADLGTIVSDVSWDFEWTGMLRQLFAPADKVLTVNALTAAETVSQPRMTCTVSFSENPSTGAQTPVGRLLTGTRQPTDKVLIGVQAPIGGEDLISDDPACAGNGVEGAGAEGQQQIQLEVPRPVFDLGMLGSQSQPFNGGWSSSDTISTSTSAFTSTVTFSGGCDATLADFSLRAVASAVQGQAAANQSCGCPNSADDALLQEVDEYVSDYVDLRKNESDVGAQFQQFVKSVRKRGGSETQQLSEVRSHDDEYQKQLRKAYEKDLKALKDADKRWLARAHCPATRSEIKRSVKLAQGNITDRFHTLENFPELAEKAIRDGCGCGGF